jgi:sigma-E factor negative regulatory protein RseB
MTSRSPHAYLFLIFLLVSPVAFGAEDAHAWLMKMERAARTLNYEGIFVYQQGNVLESMRVVHSVNDGIVRERLVSMTGATREIVRNEHEVQCYLPDENSVVIEHPTAESKTFPVILPERLSDLDKSYGLQLGRDARVAGRETRSILIEPKDNYRYGYRLWADRATGLLLKASLLDERGKTIEQFMFTSIRPRAVIPPAELQPQQAIKGRAGEMQDQAVEMNQDPAWKVEELPPGFSLSASLTRKLAKQDRRVDHLIFSDGLAAVSVFVEKTQAGAAPSVSRSTRQMGAVHAYGKVVGDHLVTVVGEVPAVTVNMIGRSVSPAR